jgi:hypothetical protein
MTSKPLHTIVIVLAAAVAIGAGADARQPAAGGAADHVSALKQSLQQGKTLIRNYEWIETTIISMKGEEKSRKQNRCYYGADGKVQKVPVEQAAQAAGDGGDGGRPGRRGARVKAKIVENKKEEISEYMQRAVGLVHRYVPPDPEQIQAAKAAGRVAATPQPGGQVRLVVSQYLQQGDSLTLNLDAAANRVLGIGVNSYLDSPDDAVTLDVQMATLPDGALYAAQTTLDAKAKHMQVVIQNSGHRPVAR